MPEPWSIWALVGTVLVIDGTREDRAGESKVVGRVPRPSMANRQRIAIDPERCVCSTAGVRGATAIRWAAALVFVVFGVGKFVDHSTEVASFRDYGLPAPGAFVHLIGVVEIAGALLLASGVLVSIAALVLAGDMIGAIAVAGLARGELVSLTLAPALLVAMVYLLVAEPSPWLGRYRRGAG